MINSSFLLSILAGATCLYLLISLLIVFSILRGFRDVDYLQLLRSMASNFSGAGSCF
jgi:hypothetical protein